MEVNFNLTSQCLGILMKSSRSNLHIMALFFNRYDLNLILYPVVSLMFYKTSFKIWINFSNSHKKYISMTRICRNKTVQTNRKRHRTLTAK